jgi:NADH-quinone oxidoreductase subunit F
MGYPHKSHARETPLLTRHFGEEEARTLDGWKKRGGYQALEKALAMTPAQIVDVVKESGLRGRGGAGFPTGMKWSFMKPGDGKPHYLCCNADESEPGTFKDREVMRWTPHALVEGCAIGAYAIGAETTYIYIRGEFTEPLVWVERAIREAYEAGILGPDSMGTGKRIDMYVHKGAGAYICGEETALMNSLEGQRGNPRIKPPFPAVSGVFGQPTTINNVETLAAVPEIIMKGAAWYKGMSLSNPKSTGTKLYSVCGNVRYPGTYEVVMGFPFGEFLHEVCGGAVDGRKLKAVIPGGASVPIQTMAEAEATLMDYEGFVAQGSMLGSGGVIVIDDNQSMVRVIARLARFFAHESCAQCTQCREGTAWTTKILERIRDGQGTMEDLDTLLDIADLMTGTTICVLSD